MTDVQHPREWEVGFHQSFEPEFNNLSIEVQDKLLAATRILSARGPGAGRPYVDTVNGSKHANMKELRFNADGGVWRVFFAFDPSRRAILLVAGNKTKGSEQRFYRKYIRLADSRYDEHVKQFR